MLRLFSTTCRRTARRLLRTTALAALTISVAGLVAHPADAACTKSWTAAVDGNWSDGTKWTPSGTPGGGDDVCITVDGTYTVTLDTNGAAHEFTLGGTSGVQTLALPGSNLGLSVGADSSIGAQGLLTMDGMGGYSLLTLQGHLLDNSGTIRTFAGGADTRRFINSGTLTNSGDLDLQGGATDQSFGALALTNMGTVAVATAQMVDLTVVTSTTGGSITNSGTFVVKGTYNQDAGTTSGNPIVIGSGGTLNLTGTGSAAIQAGGSITVQGGPLASGQSLDLPGGNTGAFLANDLSSAGLITMEGAGGFSGIFLQGHTLTNTGTIRTFPGGADTRRFISNGALASSGTMDLQGGATDSTFGGITLTNTNAISLAMTQSVDLVNLANNGGTITNNGSLTVKGTYTQGAGATSGNPIVIGSGGTLSLTGSGSAAMQAGGSITIAGSPLAAGQSLDLPGGNGGAFLANDLTNAGLITMEGTGGYSIIALQGHTLTNTGTMRTFAGGADVRRFINNGALASSGTMDLQGGATDSTFGGITLTNTNAISLAMSQSVDLVNLANNGGTITNNGSLTVKGTYTQGAGATSGNPIVIGNGGTLSLTGSGSAAMQAGGNITIGGSPLAAGQSLDMPGGNGGAFLANDLTNAGLITMEGTGGYSALFLQGHTLTNTGTLRTFAGGADGRRFINNGALSNSGTADLQGGATDSVFGQISFSNQGTTTIAPGMVLDLGGGSFTQTAAGSLYLDHDATPAIGKVTTSTTATLDGCIGGAGPVVPVHTMLTALSAGSVGGTFSCTDFVTQQFNAVYTPTQVQLVAPNTKVTVSPSSGSHVQGTAILAMVSEIGATGTPAGTVHLYEGSTLVDTETLDGTGQASLLTNSLSIGTHTLHVAYDGMVPDDPTDSGRFTITFTAPPPPPMCVANGTLKVSPGVTSTPSTRAGGLTFKGTLTGCNNFGSFTSKYPITAGTFQLLIRHLNPGATCSSLDTGAGAKYSAKLHFAFKGINPKNGKLATATAKTKVNVVSFTEQTSPFGHTAVSIVVVDPKGKNPFIGHSATLTLVYDETPAQMSASCAAKGGLKSLHFGSVVDKKVMWSPVNGASTFDLSN